MYAAYVLQKLLRKIPVQTKTHPTKLVSLKLYFLSSGPVNKPKKQKGSLKLKFKIYRFLLPKIHTIELWKCRRKNISVPLTPIS